MSATTAPAVSWQLDDEDWREWIQRALLTDGERTLAKRNGVSRDTLRRRMDRLGVVRPGPGARRGVPAGASTRQDPPAQLQATSPTALLILQRFGSESRSGGPAPSTSLLAARIRALHEASIAGDQLAFEDALLAVASAAGLIHQHQRRLRRAG